MNFLIIPKINTWAAKKLGVEEWDLERSGRGSIWGGSVYPENLKPILRVNQKVDGWEVKALMFYKSLTRANNVSIIARVEAEKSLA